MDAWDFSEPVDITKDLKKSFFEGVASKKWQERKEALESLHGLLTSNPRLDSNGQYAEVIKLLSNVIKSDANINVVAVAVKCVAGFAQGLRKGFGPFVNSLVPILLEKFKEKKPVLKEPLMECIDVVYGTTTIDAISDHIATALANKNPSVKVQTCLFLYRAILKFTSTTAPFKSINTLASSLIKLTSDPDPEVRDAALQTFGAIVKAVGKPAAQSLLGEVTQDKLKMAKVEEFCERAQKDYEEWLASQPTPSEAAPGLANGTADDQNGHVAADPSQETPKEVDPWDFLDPVDISKEFTKSFFENAASKKWQERKEALEGLLAILTTNQRLDSNGQYAEAIKLLGNVIKSDANINVAAVAVKCIGGFAQGLRKSFGPFVNSTVPVLLEKFKEKKPVLKEPLVECIDAVYYTTTLEAISEHVITALANKNPSVKVQTCLFLYRVFKNFTPSTVPRKSVKNLTPTLIKLTADPDPEVREACFQALGAVVKAVGKSAAPALLGEVAQDKLKMGKIEEFCEKATAEAEPKRVTPWQLEHSMREQGGGTASAVPGSQQPKSTAQAPKPTPRPATNGTTSKPVSRLAYAARPAPSSPPKPVSNGPLQPKVQSAPRPNIVRSTPAAISRPPTAVAAQKPKPAPQPVVKKAFGPTPTQPSTRPSTAKQAASRPVTSRPVQQVARPATALSERSRSQIMMSRTAAMNAVASSGYGQARNGPSRPATAATPQPRPTLNGASRFQQQAPRRVGSANNLQMPVNRATSETTINKLGQQLKLVTTFQPTSTLQTRPVAAVHQASTNSQSSQQQRPSTGIPLPKPTTKLPIAGGTKLPVFNRKS